MSKIVFVSLISIQKSFQFIELGRVVSLEMNHKPLDVARKGQEVCIKIEPISHEAPKMFGRHFNENDLLMSKVRAHSFCCNSHKTYASTHLDLS
jgi:translation initiation factor IF-2